MIQKYNEREVKKGRGNKVKNISQNTKISLKFEMKR
jgi:hypothetical protein